MGRGRPKIVIDEKLFKKLCGLFCTKEEIAGVFECSEDTIERWCKRTYHMNFAEVYKKESAVGKMSLRRNQFKLSEKSAAMAIFLGKNYLGQKDVVETEDTTVIDKLESILATARAQAESGEADKLEYLSEEDVIQQETTRVHPEGE